VSPDSGDRGADSELRGADSELRGAAGADTAFGRTTAVHPLGDGRYGCELDADWSALAGINGGILMALAARAIEAELPPGRDIRSLTCHFLRPPKAGAATIVVETLRTGQRATNLRLCLEQDGREMLHGLATCFTGGLREIAHWQPEMPLVPTAAEIDESAKTDPRLPSMAHRLQYGPCIGPPPLEGTPLARGEPARTGGWLQLTDPHPIEVPLLVFLCDAWWPAAIGPIDELSFNPTVDLTFHQRVRLPPGGLPPAPILLDISTACSREGLVEEDTRLYAPDGTLLAQSRQLAITLTPGDRAPVPPA